MSDRSRPCPTCGQPMPAQERRDPPLPPLEHPAVVTIHDLPEGAVAYVEKGDWGTRKLKHYFLRTARDVVDGREGSGG
jgi:hypothetical protein